jgi:hypothetical protein
MESLGSGPSSALDSTFGALFVGLLFSTFFQGLLTVQTYNYYEDFPKDSLRIKLTVAFVWVFDTIHLVLVGQSTYHYLITNWGYQPALALSTWELGLQILFIGFSTFISQIFFLNRIWVFSNKSIPIVGSILAICLTTLVLHFVVIVQLLQSPFISEFGARRGEIIAVFTAGASADVLIAGFLCYYLRRDHQSGLESTKSLIGKILQYTIATGLATSAFGIASLVAYFVEPQGFYFVAIHFCLGRMYTNALLITLNARHKFRKVLYASPKAGDVESKKTSLHFARYVSPFPTEDHTASTDHVVVTDRDNGFGKVQEN